jgi:MFS transporter, DHA1 family, multidrug resistance protein
MIANSNSIALVLAMRVVQGITVALIVVSKRAFFMDVYSGDRLKQYTSMFSIIWAMAPIVAPFIGGFLHHYFGWESNFYLLGAVALTILIFELAYGGETIKNFQSFKLSSFVDAYSSKLSKPDFVLSLVILGLSYSMVMLFNMASPFIIQQVFHESAVTTGNTALLSGMAIMTGGILSRSFIHTSLNVKMNILGPLFFVLSGVMIASFAIIPGLYTVMVTVTLMHVASGFTFNMFFTYALNRFSSHAGIVSGLTGGGAYIVTSLMSFTLVGILDVENLMMLGVGYLILTVLLAISFTLFTQAQKRPLIAVQPAEAK